MGRVVDVRTSPDSSVDRAVAFEATIVAGSNPARETKRCSKCKLEKDVGDFHTKYEKPQSQCKLCMKAASDAHYQRNKEKVKARSKERSERILREVRIWLRSYFADHPCVDCTEADFRVLEFDHRDKSQKKDAVANLIRNGHPLSVIVAEIQKCDVRCANCHRRRTSFQFGWWRT